MVEFNNNYLGIVDIRFDEVIFLVINFGCSFVKLLNENFVYI